MVIILKFHDDTDVKFHDDDLFQLHEVVGGASGGRSTQKGVSVFDQDVSLRDRPKKKIPAKSRGHLKIKVEAKSRSKLQMPFKAISESLIRPLHFAGMSISKIQLLSENKSLSRLGIREKAESVAFVYDVKKVNDWFKKSERFQKIVKLINLVRQVEAIDDIFPERKNYSFSFSERVHDEALRAFTHSSSFIGNVQYNPAEQKMKIIINGKDYFYCGISERLFDAFEGAGSKGAFFSRFIRNQYEC